MEDWTTRISMTTLYSTEFKQKPWSVPQISYQILPPSPQVRLWAPQLAFTNALGPFQVSIQLKQRSVKRSQLRWVKSFAHTFFLHPQALMFQNFQTVVDELSVATIVLENNPWHDDISQSLECKILSFQRACYIIALRLWIQCLWELSEPAKGILPGVCLWIWPALLSIWHTGKFDK